MNCLYVGYDFSEGKVGGNIVRENNYKILNMIENFKVTNFFIKNDIRKLDLLINSLKLSFNGGNKKIVDQFKDKLKKESYTHVFFDGSLYGKLVKYTKLNYPKIKIITFFHNIEVNYYIERVKVEGLQNALVLPSVMYNEKSSSKYSDKIIVLNDRDKKELMNKYKIENSTVIPISLEDKFDSAREIKECDYDYLFIGSAFFANVQGISWFIDEVLPYVPGKLLVIGKGMEKLRDKYKDSNKLKILGTVDDIEKYYYEDNIIVSPIFYGSGMKTKTIEALMYGKTIVGTEEAFVGIDQKDLLVCNNLEEFIKNLTKVQNRNSFNRQLFVKRFSLEISKEKISDIFKECN